LSHQWNATASDMRLFMLMLKLCPQLSMLFLPRLCEPMKSQLKWCHHCRRNCHKIHVLYDAVWCCMMLYVCHE
jgi:hypothetical protein